MFLIALIFYILFLLGYGFFTMAIIFHFQKYRAPGESYSFITKIFLLAIMLLAILSFITFSRVPWENMSF